MGVLLSEAERRFLEDFIAGKVDKYEYHYQRVLRKRILDKEVKLAEDLYLINKARSKLNELTSHREAKSQK